MLLSGKPWELIDSKSIGRIICENCMLILVCRIGWMAVVIQINNLYYLRLERP